MEFRDLKKQYRILQKEIDTSIRDVVENAAFIHGSAVPELEEKLARYVGVRHCISCANGTDALELSLMAWGVGKGDAVFVPDFTFFSTGEAPARFGAVPLFVDVDPKTFNMDPDALQRAILREEARGKYRLRAVISVDLFGLPADYDRIRKICDDHGLLLLEDGAQGFGGEIRGKKACSFGDISTTSFFPAKPLGCYGDGGAVFTDNDAWAELIRSLAVHGKGSSKYDNVRLGMNSRLDTLQAAVLLVKLKAFEENELEAVNRAAARYRELLADTALILPEVPEGFLSSWAQYTVRLPKGTDRKACQEALRKEGIPTSIYYVKPMHVQEAFSGTDSALADCPAAEALSETVLSLPLDPYKTEEDLLKVADVLRRSLG